MSKITNKEYYCPVCGWSALFSTNHTGEIYTHCKACDSNVLYCREGSLGNVEGTCRIIFYRYDLSDNEEKEEYNKLQEYLSSTYKEFPVREDYKTYKNMLKHNGCYINLYNINQFDNQFVSNIGRVHTWKEYVFDNKSIKCGYYLDEFRILPENNKQVKIRKRVYRSEYGNPYIKLYDGTLLELDERGRIWYVNKQRSCIVVHYDNGELGFEFYVGGYESKKYKEIKRLMNNGLKDYLMPYIKQKY